MNTTKQYAKKKIIEKTLQIADQTIAKYKMIKPKQAVLIGVSGGPDSVALVHIIKTLASKFSLRLGIAHLNHCLRSVESDHEAEFVASLAKDINLPFFTETKDVYKYQQKKRLCLEEAARHVRYAFFNKIAKSEKFNSIALGHQSDDNAELVLMYLLRGTGPLGISGIPPVRDNIIRPLFDLSRTQIIDYLKAVNLSYVTDSSNTDKRFMRNRIRHELIPFLQESYNEQIIENLNRLSRIVRDEEEWIEDYIEQVFEKSVVLLKDNKIVFSVQKLVSFDIALRRRIIRRAIKIVKNNLRQISFSHIDTIIRLLNNGGKTWILHLPNRIMIKYHNDNLTISKEKKELRNLETNVLKSDKPEFRYEIFKPETIFIHEINQYVTLSEIGDLDFIDLKNHKQNVAFFDMDRLTFPLIIRSFQPGDFFKPLGMKGTQKVKDFFINNKLSKPERANCPILVCNEEIIWVVGHRIAETFKVLSSSKNIIKGELNRRIN